MHFVDNSTLKFEKKTIAMLEINTLEFAMMQKFAQNKFFLNLVPKMP